MFFDCFEAVVVLCLFSGVGLVNLRLLGEIEVELGKVLVV